jgi:hypothetical protein
MIASASSYELGVMVQSPPHSASRPTLDGVKVSRLPRPGHGEVTYVVLTPPASAKGEKRADRRWRTHLRSGKVVDGGSVVLAESQIRDRSARGARLRLATPVTLPPQIRFFDDISKHLFEASVAWQRGRDIGIAFLHEVDLRNLSRAERFRLGMRTPIAD